MKKQVLWLLLLAVIVLTAGFGRTAQAAESNIEYDASNVRDLTVGEKYFNGIVISFYCYNCKLSSCTATGTLPPGMGLEVYNDPFGIDDWIFLNGEPTKAGTYSFSITGVTNTGKKASSPTFKITVAPKGTKYTVTTTNCKAYSGYSPSTTFYAGQRVTLDDFPEGQYAFTFTVTPKDLKVSTTSPGDRSFQLSGNSFYMPAQNVTIKPGLHSKDLGSTYHDAAAGNEYGIICSQDLTETMLLACERGLVKWELNREEIFRTKTDKGSYRYYYIDLDKDGTWDLEMADVSLTRCNGPERTETIAVLPGRNLFGSYTLNIPVSTINKYSNTGLYSKVTFGMGAPHTHSLKLVKEKAATCTAAGAKEHYECSCGSWFWDAAGKNRISNHADAIVKPLGHKMKTVQAETVTCDKDGCSWHVECENCGNWYWDVYGNSIIADHSKVITKAYGHKWSPWKVTKEATATEDGLKERYCYNNNSHKQTEVIPKTGELPTEPATTEAPAEPTTEAAPATTEAPAEPTTEAAPATTEAPAETTAEVPPATTEAPAEPKTEAPTAAPTQPAPPQTQPAPTAPPETQAPQKEGGSGNTVLIVLLGVMVLAAGVLGGILIGSSKKKGK